MHCDVLNVPRCGSGDGREGNMARVLIADDDAEIRLTVRLLLEEEGHTVHEVADGSSVLAALRDADPTVVLLDLYMPSMSGLQVLERLADEPQHATRHAFILVTANDRQPDEQSRPMLARLDVRVIRKPFDIDDLSAAVAASAKVLAQA